MRLLYFFLFSSFFLFSQNIDYDPKTGTTREYNYDSQAYIYEQLFDKPLIFLVIDKQTHSLGMFEPTQEFLERGEQKVERAIGIYNDFFSDTSKEDINTYYINEQLN